MGLLCGRAGRVSTKTAGFRPGQTWLNATKMMPQCDWRVNGSIHCDWGAQQLMYDASSKTVFLAVGNSTGGLGKGHGCDDGDGNEENGSWLRRSVASLAAVVFHH